jgi:hypothetical protein
VGKVSELSKVSKVSRGKKQKTEDGRQKVGRSEGGKLGSFEAGKGFKKNRGNPLIM